MNITIGRAEDNIFVIKDPEVSRYHAVLTRGDAGELILQDFSTTNGTFVNNKQILKKKVTSADDVTFGTSYTINIAELLHSLNDYSDDFLRLNKVYETYIREKIRIQSKNQFKTRIFQTMPFALIGIFGILMTIFGGKSNLLLIPSIILAIAAPVADIYLGARQAAKIPALMQNLANRFKIDYVCPKCGAFLGEIPWESLHNKKNCPVPSCKAKWVCT